MFFCFFLMPLFLAKHGLFPCRHHHSQSMRPVIDWLVVFVGISRQKAQEDTPEARRTRASKLAHERGNITKAAGALISPSAAPRDSRTLAMLRSKHPKEDPAAIATGKAQAEQRAGITAVGEQKHQPNATSELLDAQGQIPEMENLFEEATVKTVIKKANPQSAAGLSGLRYSHLQAALCDELVEGLAAFATLVFSSRVSPQVFRTLHTRCVCVFIKLHITTQSGPVILVILCHSH